MGGYVTWSRPIHPGGFGSKWPSATWRNGVLYPGTMREDLASTYIPDQTTSSYRTGSEEVNLQDQTLFRGTSWAAAVQGLKTFTSEGGQSKHDRGHSFNTVKTWYDYVSHPSVTITGTHASWGQLQYTGPLLLTEVDVFGTGTRFPLAATPSLSEINFWGSKAIMATTPGDPSSNVLQTLIELKREGLPKLWGATTLRVQMGHNRASEMVREFGGEHLNMEFGWKPLVSDVQSVAETMAESDMLLKKLIAKSGEPLRRRWFAPFTKTTTMKEKTGLTSLRAYPFNTSSLNSLMIRDPGKIRYTQVDEISQDISFSGAYTYHLPEAIRTETYKGIIEKAHYLLGLEMTPEVLWNIAPWSWLIDWFSNAGNIISNITKLQVDGTVLHYGYIMFRKIHKRTIIAHDVFTTSGDYIGDVVTSVISERKSRHRATPYGFGLNPATFTGRQWAILGALGLTKSDKTLRYND